MAKARGLAPRAFRVIAVIDATFRGGPSLISAPASRKRHRPGLGVVGEVREFQCARCDAWTRVCSECDHGQVYCPGDCRAIRRRESVRRAGAKYQGSPVGARKHAARSSTGSKRSLGTSTPYVPGHGPWQIQGLDLQGSSAAIRQNLRLDDDAMYGVEDRVKTWRRVREDRLRILGCNYDASAIERRVHDTSDPKPTEREQDRAA